MIELHQCFINQHWHGPYLLGIREVLRPSFNVHITDLDNFLSALVSTRAKGFLAIIYISGIGRRSLWVAYMYS